MVVMSRSPVSQLCVFVTLTLLGKRITSGLLLLLLVLVGGLGSGFRAARRLLYTPRGLCAIAARRRLRNKSQFFNDSLVRSRSVYLMGVGNVTRALGSTDGGMAEHMRAPAKPSEQRAKLNQVDQSSFFAFWF